MKPIFKSIYGSHLYGSNIETSDTDYKGIFVPSANDILMGNHPATNSENTNTSGGKNTKDDIDSEMFSLKKFLHSIVTGQTFALELLHSPKQFWAIEPDPIWLELVANKDKLISSNVTSMVSYARNQAMRYGEKGKRLEVFKDVVEWLEKLYKYNNIGKINYYTRYASNHDPFLYAEISSKHKDFVSIHKKQNDTSDVEYLDVNGVMVPLGSTVEYALEVYKPRLEEYGSRAKQAMADKGKDLKALYHAIRISAQALELLTTGTITFPRPEKDLLLKIRTGGFSDEALKVLIDESFEKVREAEKTSTLRTNPDKKWANEFMMHAHLNIIKEKENLINERDYNWIDND